MIKSFSMNTKTYNVKIDRNEVLRYLGFTGHLVHAEDAEGRHAAAGRAGLAEDFIDSMVISQLDRCISAVSETSMPKYTYKVFDLERISSGAEARDAEPKIMLANTSVEIAGNDAAKLLAQCSSCIVLAVTLGRQNEMMLRRAQITDMTEAVILDSCSSSAVESVCEQLNEDLRAEYEKRGLFLTDRYSPGYGDMPLTLQPELCGLLQTEKRIGLSVSPGLTLIPSKSVTAIIGISDRPQRKRETDCSSCRLRDTCKIREAGATCGNIK